MDRRNELLKLQLIAQIKYYAACRICCFMDEAQGIDTTDSQAETDNAMTKIKDAIDELVKSSGNAC